MSAVKEKQSSATRRDKGTRVGIPDVTVPRVVHLPTTPPGSSRRPKAFRRVAISGLLGGTAARSYVKARRASDLEVRRLRQRAAAEGTKVSDVIGP